LNKAFLAALAVLVALATVVAGCGGGDDSGTSGSLTKAEFIKKADAICEEGNDSINTEVDEFAEEKGTTSEKMTKEQQEEFVEQVVAEDIRSQAEEIGDLGAPSGDEEQIEAMVEAVEDGADEIEEEPKVLFGKANPLAEGTKLAKEYGLKVCGEE
jgi:hypothetical protein